MKRLRFSSFARPTTTARFASTSTNTTNHAPHIKYNPEDVYSDNCLLLPRLPIPPVADTLARYAATLHPLKSEAEVKAHLLKLKAFETSSATALDAKLREIDRAAANSNQYPYSYIERIWDEGYLAFRGPSPINISPGFGFKAIDRIDASQSGVAAQYVNACLRWYTKWIRGELDFAQPMNDISQYSTQFGCSRIPLPGCDGKEIVMNPKHIIVLYRGHIFRVKILDEDGKAYSPGALGRTMSHIIEVTDSDNLYPVGVTSAGGRTDYVAYMKELVNANPTKHAELLQTIRGSFMTVCLDVNTASDYDAKLQTVLHGVGNDKFNRWFDKHQLIVTKDGFVGMNFEHAFSDGMTWNRWIGEVWNHLNATTHNTPYTPLPALDMNTADTAPYDPLVFDVPASLHGIINSSKQAWENAAKNVAQQMVVSDCGRKKLKRFNISPDAFVQISLHLAFYRLSGRMAPTYESCSTASFFHGRTETIRSATVEMSQLVSNKLLSDVSRLTHEQTSQLCAAVMVAAKKHVELAKLAQQGLGVDRHLLALKALNASSPTPDEAASAFFNDSLYGYSGNWQMSTSNVSQPFLDLFCFGPVVEHGYGLGYLVHDDRVLCSVSSFTSSRKANAVLMKEAVQQSMRDLYTLLASQSK
eukprot:PhF_6_TR37056/c0_g1_i2/m.54263/K08766/CPT2; carnitine O-palmitoyltransferase 2